MISREEGCALGEEGGWKVGAWTTGAVFKRDCLVEAFELGPQITAGDGLGLERCGDGGAQADCGEVQEVVWGATSEFHYCGMNTKASSMVRWRFDGGSLAVRRCFVGGSSMVR